MRKWLLAFALSLLASPVWAACSSPIAMKDATGTSVSMDASTGSGSNCAPQQTLVQGGALVGATNGLFVQPGTSANWAVGYTNSTGTNQAPIQCDHQKFVHITTATDTLLVQGVTAKTVRVCGLLLSFSGSAAQGVFLENTASTSANCLSANTQIGMLWTGNATTPMSSGWYNPTWGGFANTSANGLCINSSGTGGVDATVFYEQG